jgi:rhomboid family GlyGly-CTERM serine protease
MLPKATKRLLIMLNIKHFPVSSKHTLVPFLIILVSCLAYIFESSLIDALVYRRSAISQGEMWRLFSGHLFHTNIFHLLLNLSAVVLLWALHGQFYSIKNYTLLLLTSMSITSIGIYFYAPDLEQYVGLSGALHGVFIFGAICDIQTKDKTGYLLFAGVVLKILHEQVYGASSDVVNLIEANVAIDAHLWGAIGGVLFSLCYFLNAKKKKLTK